MKETAVRGIIRSVCKSFTTVKLAYLFGSKARGQDGPLSDYDIAFYLAERNARKRFELKLELIGVLSRKLRSDKMDVVILNDVESPELKYNIIKEGILIFKNEPYEVLVEPKILTDFFDFRAMALRYNLTKAL